MAKDRKPAAGNTRLGIFVMAGLALLIVSLFLIGRNRHLIGSHYILRAHFEDAGGLRTGNNVRYAGIEVGTVDRMWIVDDSTLEVVMLLNREMRSVIRSNAVASLGADGLMGNRVVNIEPSGGDAPFAEPGGLIPSRRQVGIDDVFRMLSETGVEIRDVANGLSQSVDRLNASDGLWSLLGDRRLAEDLHRAMRNLRSASSRADSFLQDLTEIGTNLKQGGGTIGFLLRDSLPPTRIAETLENLRSASGHADSLLSASHAAISIVGSDIRSAKGPLWMAMRDSGWAQSLQKTILNIERASYRLDQNMEALQHNFLFRGFFRKKHRIPAIDRR